MNLTKKEKFKITGITLSLLSPLLGLLSGFLFHLRTDATCQEYAALRIGSWGMVTASIAFLIAGIVSLNHSKKCK